MNQKERRLVNPPATAALTEQFRFSQAVRVGDLVWVSGQVGFDDQMNVPAGIRAQSRLAFENLKRVLEDAGATLDDVVDLISFHVDISELSAFAEVKAEYMPSSRPAWTAVGTPALAFPELLVEVRATAAIGSAARS